MKTGKFLLAVIPFLLMGCGEEENAVPGGGPQDPGTEGGGAGVVAPDSAIVFTANIPSFAGGNIGSRSTVDNDWTGLADNRVAVQIDGTVKEYTVSEEGAVTAADPFRWEGKENVTVNAWYPYSDGVKPETVTVKADQSVAENFEASDWLEVNGAVVTPGANRLSFSHRTAKIVCLLTVPDGSSEGAVLTFKNVQGVEDGSGMVKATADLEALLVAQTIPAETEFLNVDVPSMSGMALSYTTDKEFVFESGKIYYLTVSVSEEGAMDVNISSSVEWGSADVEPLPGESTELNPDPDASWGAATGNEDLPGSSTELTPNPDTDAPSWSGGTSEDLPATEGTSEEQNN